MGLFSKSQEQKDIDALNEKIAEAGGIANAVDESNYQKLFIAQNDCMIGLLTVIASEGNAFSNTAAVAHLALYSNAKKKLIK